MWVHLNNFTVYFTGSTLKTGGYVPSKCWKSPTGLTIQKTTNDIFRAAQWEPQISSDSKPLLGGTATLHRLRRPGCTNFDTFSLEVWSTPISGAESQWLRTKKDMTVKIKTFFSSWTSWIFCLHHLFHQQFLVQPFFCQWVHSTVLTSVIYLSVFILHFSFNSLDNHICLLLYF